MMPESLYRPRRFHVRRPMDFESDDPVFEGHEAERAAINEAADRHRKEFTQPWGVYEGVELIWLFYLGDQFKRV